ELRKILGLCRFQPGIQDFCRTHLSKCRTAREQQRSDDEKCCPGVVNSATKFHDSLTFTSGVAGTALEARARQSRAHTRRPHGFPLASESGHKAASSPTFPWPCLLAR